MKIARPAVTALHLPHPSLPRRGRGVRFGLMAGIALLGAWGPPAENGWAHARPGFDTELAEKTLSQGLSALTDRPLEALAVSTIALEGLRGLGTIDPAITVQADGGDVTLGASDRIVATYPAPADDDVRGWSKLAVTVMLDAAQVSGPVRGADLEQMLEAVFDAGLSRFDLFSRYHGAVEARRLRSERNGFGGIGITFDHDEAGLRIQTVLDNSPAQKAGLKPGDVITEIDGQKVAGLGRDGVMERLRGSVASDVVVMVASGTNVPVQRTLHRSLIVPVTVTATQHNGVLTLKITSFNKKTADSIATEIAKAHTSQGPLLKGVILDLRGNPGGFLDQAVQAADLFIPSGIILETKGRHPLSVQSYEASSGDHGEALALAVLVDGRSASAAEILAGALEDTGRAVVIGTNTYGKGTVQTVVSLPNDGEITLTWSRFYTPSGYALHGLGILPTLCTALLDGAAPPDAESQVAHAATLPHDLAEWRHAGIDDGERRAKLRDLCPAQSRQDAGQDQALAEQLLSQPQLFARALALSAPPPASVAVAKPAPASN